MHWTGKVDSVAFTIFGRDVAWYGIIITCAMLIGLFVGIKLAKRVKVKSDDLLELFLIAIPLAIVGARLGFVFAHFKEFFLVKPFTWQSFVNIIAVWDGGLTILTGAPCGILGGYIWCKWRKVDFLDLADSVVCVIILSQGLGRWGNFCNQELYGLPVTNPSLQFFPYAVFIANKGGFYQATFFYEFIADLLGFALLLFIRKHLKLKGSGILSYLCVYCIIRSVMECFRDSTDILGIPNTSQLVCSIGAVLCFAAIVTLAIIKTKKGEKVWYGKGGIPDSLFTDAHRETPKDNNLQAETTADETTISETASQENAIKETSDELSEYSDAVPKKTENKTKKVKKKK